MNPTNEETQAPNFEGEKMKMPENTDAQSGGAKEPGVVNGPLLLILALLLVLILGGMYYWFSTLTTNPPIDSITERPTAEQNNEPESTTAEAQVETMQAVSTSDEITAIEADVEATNLDSLDTELEAIDAELEAALQNN